VHVFNSNSKVLMGAAAADENAVCCLRRILSATMKCSSSMHSNKLEHQPVRGRVLHVGTFKGLPTTPHFPVVTLIIP
jgi:hypothetical protein